MTVYVALLRAIGPTSHAIMRPAALRDIESLPKRFTVMPVDAQQVKDFIVRHVPA